MKSHSEWYIIINDKDYDIDIIQYFADYALVQILSTKEILIIDYLYIKSRADLRTDSDSKEDSNIISFDWWRRRNRLKNKKKANKYK